MPKAGERTRPLVDTEGLVDWWCSKLESWERQGRLRAEALPEDDDWFLRLSRRPVRRFHARKIARLFPQLSLTEAHAVTAALYGLNRYREKFKA